MRTIARSLHSSITQFYITSLQSRAYINCFGVCGYYACVYGPSVRIHAWHFVYYVYKCMRIYIVIGIDWPFIDHFECEQRNILKLRFLYSDRTYCVHTPHHTHLHTFKHTFVDRQYSVHMPFNDVIARTLAVPSLLVWRFFMITVDRKSTAFWSTWSYSQLLIVSEHQQYRQTTTKDARIYHQ